MRVFPLFGGAGYSWPMARPKPDPRSLASPRHVRLGEVLAEARRQADLTQAAVAKALGEEQSYVSRYESGFRRLDAIELLDVAEVLQADLNHILESVRKTTGSNRKD